MATVLAGIRYALFALYIICSGVLVTAAAWHLGLASTIGAPAQLDSYIVFLGAFGLLFILAVAFIDALRKYAVTSTVWFELSWVGLFWVFYLAAAAAATAIGPGMFCNIATSNVLGWKDACAAIKVIMAFTWIGTVLLLVHLFTLLALSLLHAPQSPSVWHSGVRDFPWLDFPTRPSFRNSYHYARRMTAQPGAAPVSMQPAVTAPIHAKMTSRVPYPSHTAEHYPTHPYAAAAVPRPVPAHDLESSQPHQYKPARDPHARTPSQAIIEQYRAGKGPSSRKPVPGQVQSTIVRALPKLPPSTEVASPRPRRANPGLTEGQITSASQPTRKLSEPMTVGSFQSNQPQSLYPMHVQATMESAPSTVSHEHEPQPLGQWPRRNPPADPRRERNAAPPAFRAIPAAIPSAGPMTAAGARERVARRMNSAESDSSVDSDGVPRRRDGRPKHRPPPLDFSRLNAGRQ